MVSVFARPRSIWTKAPRAECCWLRTTNRFGGLSGCCLQTTAIKYWRARRAPRGWRSPKRRPGTSISCFTDMLLPELSGFDLAQKALERNPDLKVLFMTGYVEGDIVQRGISELGATFLDKPFQPATLLSRVHDAIASANEIA